MKIGKVLGTAGKRVGGKVEEKVDNTISTSIKLQKDLIFQSRLVLMQSKNQIWFAWIKKNNYLPK